MPSKKAKRSLRTILSIWFLLFSLIPLVFVTVYSIKKYEMAIDNELAQRLGGNAREIGSIFEEYRSGITTKRDKYIHDNSLQYHLSTGDPDEVKDIATQWLSSDFSSSLSFFNREGRMLVSVFKDEKGEVRNLIPQESAPIYLTDQNLDKLKNLKEYAFVEFSTSHNISLILYSKILNKLNKHIGYLEQVIEIDQGFLNRLKNRMKLELIILRSNGQVGVGTHPDFYLYKREIFQDLLKNDGKNFIELNIRSNPYGFLLYPLTWGSSEFFIALGASKAEAKSVLENVNYAFYTVVGTVILFLLVTIFFASNTILRPLDELLEALQDMQTGDKLVEIPIKSETEIGLLAESFNEMSRKVAKARTDLKKKLAELEKANQELKDTQSKLVHSSKMVSLGQLVAGVAHELNNPIGFIYSNMSHLKEYSEKLIKLADIAEFQPEKIKQAKSDLDIEFIRQDLPKLVSSCEDGARRTRDIVLGLRNFSRLEEAKLKEIDIHESIDNTLNLLSGEIKNRIQVLKDYGNLPLVTCYGSQINQVFMNILSNAVQAIEGTGNIWITTRVIEKLNSPKKVQISFQDSGKGMTSQVMEKIFDPFFSTKGVGQGTGLGLSISYGIIESHGGDIQVKSQVGIGTEFVLTIPVKSKTLPDPLPS